MDLKQKRYNKKRKKYIAKILGIVFLFIITIGGMKLYQYCNRNPFLVELRQIVAEEYGGDFSVTINCSKNEKISVIEIEASDEIYLKNDIFSKVDNLQKIIYEYVIKHQDEFCDIDSVMPRYENQYQEKEGLELRFENSSHTRSSGLSNVFCFYNKVEYKNQNKEGFNSLYISEVACRSDSYYLNIKTSVLGNFSDINYLQCWNIFVDDISFIKKLKNLKEISVGKYDEEIKKAAKEAGVKCN